MDLKTTLRLASKLASKRGAFPEYVILQATSRCNVKCAHCFLWADTDYGWENTQQGKHDLTLEELRKVSASMPEFYFMNVTGGEPFLRPDLPEIIEAFYRNNRLRALLVPTNGTVRERTRASVEAIAEACPELALTVDVSLDGLGERHDRIRGAAGTFERALETFRELQTLQPRLPRLQLGVILAVMRSNQEQLDALYEFARDQLRPDSISVALVRGHPLDPEEKRVDLARYRALTARLDVDLLAGRVRGFRKQDWAPLTLAAKLRMHRQVADTVERGFQSPCYAALLNAVIYSNGDVYPCELLGPERKLGNLREWGYDFRRLWRTAHRRATARWIQESRCHCTHECHIPVNLLFNPRRLPALLAQSLRLLG